MISIRRMTAVDVLVSQVLLSQLGYQMDVQEVRRRYDAVAQSGDHALMVAEQGGSIIALCESRNVKTAYRVYNQPRRSHIFVPKGLQNLAQGFNAGCFRSTRRALKGRQIGSVDMKWRARTTV